MTPVTRGTGPRGGSERDGDEQEGRVGTDRRRGAHRRPPAVARRSSGARTPDPAARTATTTPGAPGGSTTSVPTTTAPTPTPTTPAPTAPAPTTSAPAVDSGTIDQIGAELAVAGEHAHHRGHRPRPPPERLLRCDASRSVPAMTVSAVVLAAAASLFYGVPDAFPVGSATPSSPVCAPALLTQGRALVASELSARVAQLHDPADGRGQHHQPSRPWPTSRRCSTTSPPSTCRASRACRRRCSRRVPAPSCCRRRTPWSSTTGCTTS